MDKAARPPIYPGYTGTAQVTSAELGDQILINYSASSVSRSVTSATRSCAMCSNS